MQIPGVLFETVVVDLMGRYAGRWREGRLARAVTLVWVAGFLSMVLPLLVVPFREIGYWRWCAVPVSFCRGVMGEGWVMWG